MASLNSVAAALSVVTLWAAAGAVCAQELSIDQSKIYVTNLVACQKLQDEGQGAFTDLGFLGLSFTEGIQSMEFHCDFMDVKGRKDSRFLFVSAVCEAPGEVYPDTMSISPYDETTIQVVSTNDTMMAMVNNIEPQEGDTTNPGTTLYHRCDNLSEFPH